MKSKNGGKFHYSSYWGSISRCLQMMTDEGAPAIEIAIFPINPSFEVSWAALAEVRVRYHRTIPGRGDTFTDEVGDSISELLMRRVGERVHDVLMHEDLLAQIDPDKLERARQAWRGGGGIPYILICKDPSAYPELIQYWQDRQNFVPTEAKELFVELFALTGTLVEKPPAVLVNNVPSEWLVHYAELVEEGGDIDLAQTIRDHIQSETGVSYQDIQSQLYVE